MKVWTLLLKGTTANKKKGEDDAPKEDASKAAILNRIVRGSWLPNEFVPTVKRYALKDLQLTTEERIVGSIWSPTYVRGFYDMSDKGGVIQFMKEDQVPNLENMLEDFYLVNANLDETFLY